MKSLEDKLLAVTVARGASPAEEATARAMLIRIRGRQDRRSAETFYNRQKAMARGLASMFKSAPVADVGHSWGERVPMPPPHKWCQECRKCGTFRVTSRSPEGEWVHSFVDHDGNDAPPVDTCS